MVWAAEPTEGWHVCDDVVTAPLKTRSIPSVTIRTFEATLPTKAANEDGVMVVTARKTTVSIYDPKDGEQPMIYELGISVVETDIRWHIRVGQKVPLNKDRDNVTPAYRRALCTAVAEEMQDALNKEDANTWGRTALADSASSKPLREKLVKERFGSKPAVPDPKDGESKIRWQTEHGGTLVYAGMLSGSEWEAVKEYDLIPSTGRLAPTPKPWSDDPRALPADFIPQEYWTDGMRQVANYAGWVARHVLGVKALDVAFAKRMNNASVAACYAPDRLEFNMQRLGRR